MFRPLAVFFLVVAVLGTQSHWCPVHSEGDDWSAYGHDPGGTKYSSLTQINRSNVKRLRVAWTYRSGSVLDFWRKRPLHEATPIFADGTLFFSTAFGRVIALDPNSGRERWVFDAKIPMIGQNYTIFASRGVSTWLDPDQRPVQTCRRRIFVATVDARLVALDASTGLPCPDFGSAGELDLKRGLKRSPEYSWEYTETTPPAVAHGLVIVGSAILDNANARAASGEVRAFDARSGKLRWTWNPIMDLSNTGAGNAWSSISVDLERNLVFIPTSSPSPDYFGGLRKGDNRWSDSIVALHLDTGVLAWAFQTVHHDLWDYDVAAQPLLFTSGTRAAVIIGSKTGNLFFLDRTNGIPLFGVEERRVPRSDVPGEEAWPTQPFPKLPKPLVPPPFTQRDIYALSAADQKWCATEMNGRRAEGIFTPPSLRGSLISPGNIGGIQWGGEALDPVRKLLIVPTNRVPAIARLFPREQWKQEVVAHPEWRMEGLIGTPYVLSRYFLIAPDGIPCSPPPWGTLTAIETETGLVRWEVPLGHLSGASPKYGAPNLGGPIVTAGGLVFIGASQDPHIRAFDAANGNELWESELPSRARATPMTYRTSGGKQFLVIMTGDEDQLHDQLIAWSLP